LPSDSEYYWLTAEDVRELHGYVLEPDQLKGEYPERSIEAALNRVVQKVHYGELQSDVLQIAASYAVVISRAHSFVDGNKRTALLSMLVFLEDHGYQIEVDGRLLADKMEQCAAGDIDDSQLWDFIFDYLTECDSNV
jgi:death-on-curing protein